MAGHKRTAEGKRKQREYIDNWWKNAPITKKLLYWSRRRASVKGELFDIEESDIIVPNTCPILGIPLFVGEGRHSNNSPSLDKIDPSLGYAKGNIAVISYKANSCKNNMTPQQIERLYKYVFRLE